MMIGERREEMEIITQMVKKRREESEQRQTRLRERVPMISNIMVGRFRMALLMCVLGLWGCGEDPRQLFETAQFEEQQGNHTHAIQIYEQIIQMDDDSEWAQKAKERITKLKP